jgi:hypothetical protein
MRTSTGLSLVPGAVPVPRHGMVHRWLAATLRRTQDALDSTLGALRSPRRRRPTRQDLPWDVGLDYLAEQANPTWIPRGW